MMNYLFKTILFILLFTSTVFSSADGPDYLDVRDVASNDVLWMHPTPNYKSKRIGKIPFDGKCLKNLGYKGKWCKVKYKGIVGWVNGKFLMEGGSCQQDSYGNDDQKKLRN